MSHKIPVDRNERCNSISKITFIFVIFDVLLVCYISLWPFYMYVHIFILCGGSSMSVLVVSMMQWRSGYHPTFAETYQVQEKNDSN